MNMKLFALLCIICCYCEISEARKRKRVLPSKNKAESSSASTSPSTQKKGSKIVVFLSDYGNNSSQVVKCKGSILGYSPETQIIDLAHDIRPFNREEAAQKLSDVSKNFPSGTVFLGIVDPGWMNGNAKPMVVRSKKGHFFVVPNNGLISLVIDTEGVEDAKLITNPTWIKKDDQGPFSYGPDIYCPVAGRLATGESWDELGPEAREIYRINTNLVQLSQDAVSGMVQSIDSNFGNVATNITKADVEKFGVKVGDQFEVVLAPGKTIAVPFVTDFIGVPEGNSLAFLNSEGRLTLAINRGNFSTYHQVKPMQNITLMKKKNG